MDPYKYSDRYHWIIERDKLEAVLRAEKSPELQVQVLKELEPLLRGNKMWPMPTSKNTEHWTQEVMNNSKIDQRNKIALLQNEYIYQNKVTVAGKTSQTKEEAAHNKKLIQTILTSLHAPVLASLDIKDAPQPPRLQNRNISPVLEGDADFAQIPQGMREMGPEHIYRIHDPIGRVPDFILSHVAPLKMNHADGIAYCRDRGGLPNKKELEALGRAMGRGQPGGYRINLIPEMKNRWFWSSSPFGAIYAFSFNGSFGNVDHNYPRSGAGSVRCVREAAVVN